MAIERSERKTVVLGALAMAALVAVLAALLAFGASQAPEESLPAQEPAEAEAHEVSFTVEAEGAEEAAVDATYELADAGGGVVESGSIEAGRTVSFELEEGSYAFELLSAPVLKDGTTYELPDPIGFEVSESMDELDFDIELQAVAADDMTAEQLEAVADELEAAGDVDAASAAREHAASAPSVAGSTDAVKRNPAPASPSGQGGSQQPSTSGGSPEPEPDPEPSEPVHTHSWVPQTEQRWVVDQAAWTERVPYSVWKCLGTAFGGSGCGLVFYSAAEAAAHQEEMMLQGDFTHNGTVLTEYRDVYHEEVGHWETVTTGYKCSGCGAWQ